MIFSDRREEAPEHLQALYGSGNLDSVFPEQIPKSGVPWQRASRRKASQDYDQKLVQQELSRPLSGAQFHDVDPRMLRSTQPSITRAGVQHYLSDDYRKTGETFADKGNVGNRHPFVYSRHDPETGETQEMLLAGHHRAAAALLQGKPLRARRVEGGWGPAR